MSSTSQIALPLELWHQITSYLTNRDIKSMRLATKQFSTAVELRLQRCFVLSQIMRSLGTRSQIVWDNARLLRGPLIRRRLPGWESEMILDEEISDNETEISCFQGSYELDWPREYSDDEDEDEDEDDEGDGDPSDQLRRSTKFRKKDCSVWYKAGCAASVEDAFWRQAGDDWVDVEDPDCKTMRQLGSIGPPLSECWEFYRTFIRQQDDVLVGKSDEEAFIHGLKRFPALPKVNVTPAAHGFLFNPLYQTPMIRSFPERFNYPMPRGWPLPSHEQPEENNIVEFSVDSRLLRTGINCTIIDDTCEEYNHLATLLKKPGFRRLDLSFTLAGTWQSFPHEKLHNILREAGDLEELSLATTGIDAENEHKNLHNVAPVPLNDIFPIENWPKLQHFELSRLIVSESDVKSFLAELPATMRSVRLSFLTFVDNRNWHSFLAKMREEIRESRLWSDRLRTVTIGCNQDISLPGRARWIGEEVDGFLYGDGQNPFHDPPINMPREGYGTKKDQLDPSS
ncbi:hypothetical protein N7452_010896 [Penicillium brevicompactum]|uniref:F-box domain-containing protein n=1 Tax=Penicillium brevicompactum TaxID=5074 RepID=A0A9W9U717_PENBR|nr:hypothetical protein N7452_010896 [Penicillium brevicompactum]